MRSNINGRNWNINWIPEDQSFEAFSEDGDGHEGDSDITILINDIKNSD